MAAERRSGSSTHRSPPRDRARRAVGAARLLREQASPVPRGEKREMTRYSRVSGPGDSTNGAQAMRGHDGWRGRRTQFLPRARRIGGKEGAPGGPLVTALLGEAER